MIGQESTLNRKTSVLSLAVALITSFIGANRWRLAAKSAQEQGDQGLAHLLQRQTRRRPRREIDHAAIKTLKLTRKYRRLSVGESEQLFELSRDKLKVELQIYFGPGSADISPAAEPALDEIGEALARARANVTGGAFLLAGHTCRKGGVVYATELSMERAEAIKAYLVKNFAIDADALLPHGYGFRHLKNPKSPFSDENHRFEIVNLCE
jgi:outer membrane protein OmpA-like peptidoglycan-associated protein